MEWRDIETAPKDGSYVLGYDAVTAAQFNNPNAGICAITWVEADEDNDWEAEWQVQPFVEGLDCVISEVEITHWMPLPSPPESDT